MDVDEQHTSSDSQGSALSHRRPPAHQSVSLLHDTPRLSPRHRRTRQKPAVRFTPDISATSQPVDPEKNGSGESSNAEKWFEKSNNNVKMRVAELDDNDPPFFLRNSSSSEASPNMSLDVANESRSQPPNAPLSLPFRALSQFPPHSQDDSSDEFRSVIDDLTIENKKLRKKLRKYEKLHNVHLQADKMFEIRIHRLPADKRRELEETLQKFAASLESPKDSKQAGKSTERFAAKLQTASSLANTDSGYASMSGQNQSLQSGQGNNVRATSQAGMSQEQQQNIQSYLHEIPVGLFPQHRTAMTEKARRKLVVRRMEQIFAGKGAANSGHQQPIQQQEVSNSAAHADRVDQGKEGREHDWEGSREARIVPISKHHGESKSNTTRSDQYVESMDIDRRRPRGDDDPGDAPDQRPTRPLDLDPYRAQVPSDNIRYMRHLGFSPPEADVKTNLADDHGWVYLNVLTNMAQLHTINVTVDFVKRSISEYSDKLELSPDGRKVRWKGGKSLTRTSSDGSPDGSTTTTGKPMEAPQMLPDTLVNSAVAQTANKLAYKPLFFRQEEPSDSEGEEESDTWTSPARINAGESGGMDSEGQVLSSPRRRRGDDGPIIFYNKAQFFTDLSGDNHGAKIDLGNIRHYSTNSVRPVGLSRNGSSLDEEDSTGKRGPLLKEGANMIDAVDTDQSSSSEDLTGLSTRPASSRHSSTDDVPRSPINFEVSGIGGVHPSDNFSINVRSRQRRAPEVLLPTIPEAKIKQYTSRIQAILAGTHLDPSQSKKGQQHTVIDEIIKSEREDLPASRLPDPSFYHFGGDGEDFDGSGYDSDSETDGSEASTTAPDLAHRAVPTSAPQLMNWTAAAPSDVGCIPGDDVDDQSMDGEDGDDDDGSIDMLAIAREIDPNLIRAKEREYDGGVADRLAEEIPAGSSAATAGGGSGFNSPQLYHAGKKVPSLKRAREEGPSAERARTKSPKVEGQQVR